MFLLRKPSPEAIQAFLARQGSLGLTYRDVGATATVPPAGYLVNHTRIRLGEGPDIFRAGKQALQRWDQLRLGWVQPWPDRPPIEVGQTVAILARSVGLWWLNACRIVAVVDEDDRFGFAYGTLPDHAGTGEERFLVEREPADGAVWYDLLAFSRPHQLLTWIGAPYMRRIQRQFSRQSAAAMLRAVHGASGPILQPTTP